MRRYVCMEKDRERKTVRIKIVIEKGKCAD
jgi:hypothetical protein